MVQRKACSLFGDTDEVSCVPDCISDRAVREVGPVFDADGALIISESFAPAAVELPSDLQDMRLADAFCIWECYAEARVEGSPLLLRFDDLDIVVVEAQQAAGAVWCGVVDTEGAVKAVRSGTPDADRTNDSACLIWRRVEGWERGLSASRALARLA